MNTHIRTIEKRIKMESVELTEDEVTLHVIEKIKYTDIKTGSYFFLVRFPIGSISSEVFPAEAV